MHIKASLIRQYLKTLLFLSSLNINLPHSLKKYRIGIVGATGAVGQEIISLLEKREFPVAEARLLASANSAGRQIQACGKLRDSSGNYP